ncbi:Choline-sulfatase [Lunatimonas lonarensis]|uniref:Choline-sulfatase n=1 Tax=Lunatimonas lonarensis TaxID=1232681 RepID=R7ZRI8_9BACT|nr:sulfatase [Lunatimonas lonarensis]EON76692.1 Choline-sulfatase [Lunatimonas lonarensis]
MYSTPTSLCIALLLVFSVALDRSVETRFDRTNQPTYIPTRAAIPSAPNIVFLISEDNSKHFMDLFDPSGVEVPAIRGMAKQGVTYSHAFSNAPVCSVARSTLITGTLATRTGMHLHRKIKLAPMPEGLEMFPAYLRKAGYYTTNNAKKDYNAEEGPDVWDDSSNQASWRGRPVVDQPFFHQETFMESHESRLHFGRDLMGSYQPVDLPESIKLAPFYPDTPIFRFTTAYHRDKIREIDRWVGEVLGKLEADGQLENTFVFYFGDHGGVLPGSKGYLYETGLHVPLVVRIPKNFEHLVDTELGGIQEGFVSFIDFAPTALALAGIAVPSQMDGRAFLGKGIKSLEVAARDEAIGYADRFDEKYDLVRSLRKGRYKYIRSYQPFYPDALHNNYRYKMLAFSEWRDLHGGDRLDSLQNRFFLPKPVEMLFDLEEDPFEIRNLAGVTEFQPLLRQLRKRLSDLLLEKHDLGFLPENLLVAEALKDPVSYGNEYQRQLVKLLEINDLGTQPFADAKGPLLRFLEAGTSLEKYWAITVASGFGVQAAPLAPTIRKLRVDENAMVALRAIEFMGIAAGVDPNDGLIELINGTRDPVEVLIALNSLVYFRDHTSFGKTLDASQVRPVATNEEVSRRLAYLKGTW